VLAAEYGNSPSRFSLVLFLSRFGVAVTHRRTLTEGTAPGTVMVTAAYMVSEQAPGISIDKRTDIWASGCTPLDTVSRLFLV
jgi:serine/threonine protein kinase